MNVNKTHALLREALYQGRSIPEVLKLFEKALKAQGDLESIAHAVKIKQYYELIENRSFLSRIRKNFNGTYNIIDKDFPELRFRIDGRRKSLKSTELKIENLVSEKESLDMLRDMFAFRVLLFGKNTHLLLKECYSVMNRIIEYFLMQGFILCDSGETKNTRGFDISQHPQILISKKSEIKEIWSYGVKDYILNPKQNGYQSLHASFRAPTGECFEIQIRTFEMHVHAESGVACHTTYKNSRYSPFEFDRSKIEIPGYGVSPDGKVYDYVGLEEGLEILRRQKTF